ncbi:MAG: hypothetical protein ACOWWR_07625 [Eubacteriales bacterium]
MFLYEENDDTVLQKTDIDLDGTFQIQITEDGNYTLKAQSQRGNAYMSNEITFTIEKGNLLEEMEFNFIISNKTLEQTSSISLQKSKINGKVRYPQDVSYVDIKVILSNKIDGEGLKFYMIDPEGNFEMNSIDDGTYYICAKGPNDEISQWLKIDIVDGVVVENEDIILEIEDNTTKN